MRKYLTSVDLSYINFLFQDKNRLAKHSEKVFCIHCKCQNCLISRKLIIGIHVENEAYNDLWEKLKEIISSYYNMLPK